MTIQNSNNKQNAGKFFPHFVIALVPKGNVKKVALCNKKVMKMSKNCQKTCEALSVKEKWAYFFA